MKSKKSIINEISRITITNDKSLVKLHYAHPLGE